LDAYRREAIVALDAFFMAARHFEMPDHADVQQVAAMIEPLRTEMMLGSASASARRETMALARPRTVRYREMAGVGDLAASHWMLLAANVTPVHDVGHDRRSRVKVAFRYHAYA
jgi:hypothetical protein